MERTCEYADGHNALTVSHKSSIASFKLQAASSLSLSYFPYQGTEMWETNRCHCTQTTPVIYSALGLVIDDRCDKCTLMIRIGPVKKDADLDLACLSEAFQRRSNSTYPNDEHLSAFKS